MMRSFTKSAVVVLVVLAVVFVVRDFRQKSQREQITQVAGGGDVVPLPTRAEKAAEARKLVESLTKIDVRTSPPTPAQVDAWKHDLITLLQDGIDAVPPMAEFFQTNADIRFDAGPGPNLFGEPTLRIAFIKVLFDISTPDNVDLQVKLLAETKDPDEVLLLARQLEMQEPGKHRDAILLAANASLERVRSGQFAGRDVTALTALVKTMGK